MNDSRQGGAGSTGVVIRLPFPAIGITPVKRLEVLDLFELAEIFADCRPKLDGHQKGMDVFFACIRLEGSFKKFEAEQGAFSLTRDSARRVISELSETLTHQFYDGDPKRNKMKPGLDLEKDFETWQLYELRTKIEEFRHVLSAECRKSETYFVEKKVGFDVATLLHSAEENLHSSIQPFVPASALSEIREAGRCLALECYTACGFHILRGLEVVMAAYYKRVSAKEREFRSWHDYVEALTELEKGENGVKPKFPSPKVAAMLDRMRQLERNPLMHPSDTLDEMAADTLFKLSIVTITELAKDMRDMAGQTEMRLVTGDAQAAE